MARIGNYSNTLEYSKRKSFDGSPVESGKILAPFRKNQYDLRKEDYIQDNFTTMHFGEFSYKVGFMQIDEACFETYMRGFWAELNEDMKMRREGRCIIGKNPDGSDKLCPYIPTPEGVRAVRKEDSMSVTIRTKWRSCPWTSNTTEKPLISKTPHNRP